MSHCQIFSLLLAAVGRFERPVVDMPSENYISICVSGESERRHVEMLFSTNGITDIGLDGEF